MIDYKGRKLCTKSTTAVMIDYEAASHSPKIDPRWTNENEASHDVQEFVGMPKISRRFPKLMPMQEKHNRGSYDGLQRPHEWLDV